MQRDVIADLGDAIDPHVMLSPESRLEDSVADPLARARKLRAGRYVAESARLEAFLPSHRHAARKQPD